MDSYFDVPFPDCDYCGRYESGYFRDYDGSGNKLNLCECCAHYDGHSKTCACEDNE